VNFDLVTSATGSGFGEDFLFAARIAPNIAIAPIAEGNVVDADAIASGFTISGSESGADGQTVTVRILDSTSTAQDTLTTTATGGAWSVAVTAAQAQALAAGNYSITADVSNAAGLPALEASQA